MKEEWDPLFSDYLEKYGAWQAREKKRRDDEFAQLPNPTAEANYDLHRFLAKYFLDGHGQPDKTKTPDPLALPGYDARPTLHAAAERIPGLETHSGGSGDDRTIVIGWDRSAVWRHAGQIDAESWEKEAKHKQEAWENSLNKHRHFLKEQGRKAPRVESLKSYIGSYLIACQDLSAGWDTTNDMTLDISDSSDPHVLEAAFDFGVLEGIMLLSFSEAAIKEFVITLDDNKSEDDAEQLVRGKRVRKGSSKQRKKAIKSEFPKRTRVLRLQWRGRETGEGEIQLDDDSNPSNVGQLEFADNTLANFKGFMNIPFAGDKVEVLGYKVNAKPKQSAENWNNFSKSRYESERMGRWR